MIQTKKIVSPLDGVAFKDTAYETNDRFSIYTAKPDNYLLDLLQRTTRPNTAPATQDLNSGSRLKNKLQREIEESRLNMVDTAVHPVTQPTPAESLQHVESVSPATQEKFDQWQRMNQQTSPTKNNSATLNGRSPQSILKNSNRYMGESMNQRLYNTNPFSETRSIGSAARTARSHTSKKSHRSQAQTLRESLYFDSRTQAIPKSSIRSTVIEDIIRNEGLVTRNPALVDSLIKLRDMNLLKDRDPRFQKYKGAGKVEFVYNDFHSRNTNPGYSRNKLGSFYNH